MRALEAFPLRGAWPEGTQKPETGGAMLTSLLTRLGQGCCQALGQWGHGQQETPEVSWGELAAIGCCQAGVMGPWAVAGAAPKLAGVRSQE